MLREGKRLSIVVPMFNEEDIVTEMFRRLTIVRERLAPEAAVDFVFVDDGSSDSTRARLMALADEHPHVKLVVFTRNFGHQIAVTAGLDHAAGDHVAIIDGDLQDPPELVVDMYRLACAEGWDVVYGQRRQRHGETMFKKASAAAFYRVLSYLCDIDIPMDTGDFRLVSRRVAKAFQRMPERHRFIRGMVPWLGFRSIAFPYDRDRRHAGVTKYPLRKMLSFAANAILSFSRKPLAIAARLGLVTVGVGVAGSLYMLYLKLFTSVPVPGLTAIILTIVLFGGVQILLIGMVGEYVARVFEEAKGRPLYVIDVLRNLEVEAGDADAGAPTR